YPDPRRHWFYRSCCCTADNAALLFLLIYYRDQKRKPKKHVLRYQSRLREGLRHNSCLLLHQQINQSNENPEDGAESFLLYLLWYSPAPHVLVQRTRQKSK